MLRIQDDVEDDRLVQINIKGKTKTPLFIGGQYPNDSNEPDETFMTTADGKPLIPGSSLKGVLAPSCKTNCQCSGLKEKEKYIAYLFGSDESQNLNLVRAFYVWKILILTKKKQKFIHDCN